MLSRKLGVTVAGIFTGVGLTLLAAFPDSHTYKNISRRYWRGWVRLS